VTVPGDSGEDSVFTVATGNPAVLGNTRRPVALRPQLSMGLPLSLRPMMHNRPRLGKDVFTLLETYSRF